MKSLNEIYTASEIGIKQNFSAKNTSIGMPKINCEIEKNFNKLFIQLKQVFPTVTALIKTQIDLDEFKNQWLLAFKENGITTLRQFEIGMKKARQQSSPFVPAPGQFVSWCKEGEASDMGLPSVAQVMLEFNRYSAEIGFSFQTAEEFPWSHPVMYWIVTDLRLHMKQYNQSLVEVEQRAALLINKWAKKLSNGEVVPKIRVQIEHKPEPVFKTQYHETQAVKDMWERIRAKRSRENG